MVSTRFNSDKSGTDFRFTGFFKSHSSAAIVDLQVFTEASQAPYFDLQGFYSVKPGPLFRFTGFLQTQASSPLSI